MADTVHNDTRLTAAKRAVYVAFMGSGWAMSSWATRIPQIRDGLELTPSRLGLLLLAIAAGSIVALPLAGIIVTRLGSRATITAMAGLLGVSMTGIAFGYQLGVVPVAISLFGFGFAQGAWDVAMNVQGAVVERKLGKSIMSRFHAGFSVGMVAGALTGTATLALHISVTVHLIFFGLAIAAAVIASIRWFIPDTDADPVATTSDAVPQPSALSTWTEPRTLLVGLFVLAFAFAEGTGVDWIAVAVIDDYGAPATSGTLTYAIFLAAMTTGRWFGPGLLDRYGRVRVLRVLALIALAGLCLFVFGASLPVAFAGACLWGLGTSLGFPVGMSAAADDPSRAASRVSVVASVGYCAFLGGPPLIGFLGDHITVQKGLIAVAALLAIALMITNVIRPLDPTRKN
ncbi:MFS transporter [Actinoplanes sp. NBRC 103695]|uniref:MFS transporter n=1 Tax=Actinoplanes sp. NBRC 103695 TaxID=3032202 RepID=UPI0024A31C69|nr:MFS transporter [Actinoplanes sp. NBRC 103695]GLY98182.1 MFS transporter [Actinoplanes sp. NBRC 103695]